MSNIDNDQNENLIDDSEEATVGMSEIDGFDFNRAVMLMTVQEKVANTGVKCTAIGGLAAAALNEMNEEAKAIGKRRAEELAKLEAQAKQKALDEARAREEAEAAEREEADEAARVVKTPASAPAPRPNPEVPRAIPSKPAPAPTDGRRL